MGKNQSASNLTNIIKQDANGSISFMHGNTMLMQVSSSGAITTTGVISGSNALSASYAVSASAAASAVTAVTAQTSSFANAFTVAGNLTAQTLVVQTITSSVDFVTGSTRFGSLAANTHQFTGSVSVSGSIGIGLSNPTNKLEVQAGDIKINAGVSSTANLYFGITGTNYGKIQYNDSNGSMFITTIGAGSGYDLNLGTKENIRLSILGSNGNVLISTTTSDDPVFKLQVGSGSADTRTLFKSNNPYAIGIGNGAADLWYQGVAAGTSGAAYQFYNNYSGAVTMTLTTGNNVGIGTATTYGRLHVNGPSLTSDSETTYGIWISSAATIEKSLILGYDSTNDTGIINAVHRGIGWKNISIGTNSSNVGIGTTSPSYKLHVLSGANQPAKFASGNSILYTTFANNGGDVGYIGNGTGLASGGNASDFGIRAENNLIFTIGNNEKMRVSSAGNVGIGTTSPGSKLDVNGTINASSYLTVMGVTTMYYAGSVSGNGSFTINVTVTDQSSLRITAVMNHYGYIYDYGCARMSLVANGPIFTEINISNTASANGGSWSFSRVNNTTVSITKNAGSYGGGGLFFVEIVGYNPSGYNW